MLSSKSSVCFTLTVHHNMDATFSVVQVKCDPTKIISLCLIGIYVIPLLFLNLKYFNFYIAKLSIPLLATFTTFQMLSSYKWLVATPLEHVQADI